MLLFLIYFQIFFLFSSFLHKMKYPPIHAILIFNVVITVTISSDANLDISKSLDDYYYSKQAFHL
jgi:hypothetical protein